MRNAVRRPWLWLLPLLLLTTWLGARGLDADAIWFDEYRSIYYAGGPGYGPLSPSDIWNRVIDGLTPGYFLLLGGWGSLAGWTPFAARALSLLLGLPAVAVVYRLGCNMARQVTMRGAPPVPARVGLGAAVALGASAFYIDYLHEMRFYTLYALCAALSVWLYWRLVAARRTPGWVVQAAFVLSGAALLYAHYFGALVVASLGLYHLLFAPKNRRWWHVAGLAALAGLLYLPWFQNMWRVSTFHLATGSEKFLAMPTADVVGTVVYAFSNGTVILLLLTGGAALLVRARPLWLLWFLAGCFLVLALIVHTLSPVIIHIRYLIGMWPLLALIVGFGVDRLARLGIRPVVVLGLWIAAGVWGSLDPAFIDYVFGGAQQTVVRRHLPLDALSDVLHDRVLAGDVVALHVPAHDWTTQGPFEFYMHDLPAGRTVMEALPGEEGSDEFYWEARCFVGGAARAWVAVERNYQGVPPNFRLATFERALGDEGYTFCARALDVPYMYLDLYARAPDACNPSRPVDAPEAARFGDSVVLRYASPLPARIADDTLHVWLTWSGGNTVTPYAYSVALHVVDADNMLRAQTDYGLPMDAYVCRAAEIDVSALPPGEYALLAMVYNWGDGQRLLATDAATGAQGEWLSLGTVEIAR